MYLLQLGQRAPACDTEYAEQSRRRLPPDIDGAQWAHRCRFSIQLSSTPWFRHSEGFHVIF